MNELPGIAWIVAYAQYAPFRVESPTSGRNRIEAEKNLDCVFLSFDKLSPLLHLCTECVCLCECVCKCDCHYHSFLFCKFGVLAHTHAHSLIQIGIQAKLTLSLGAVHMHGTGKMEMANNKRDPKHLHSTEHTHTANGSMSERDGTSSLLVQ